MEHLTKKLKNYERKLDLKFQKERKTFWSRFVVSMFFVGLMAIIGYLGYQKYGVVMPK